MQVLEAIISSPAAILAGSYWLGPSACDCHCHFGATEADDRLLDIVRGQLDRCGPDHLVPFAVAEARTDYAGYFLVFLLGVVCGCLLCGAGLWAVRFRGTAATLVLHKWRSRAGSGSRRVAA